MIINRIHRDKIKNISINSSVKNGIIPASINIKSIMNDYSNNFNIGDSNTNFFKIKSFSKSEPKKWNKLMNTLLFDIETLFEANDILKNEINKIGNEALELQDKAIVENKKINKRIENIKNILANNTSYQNNSYMFDSFKNIEFYLNKERNLPETTSFIDLRNKKATNFKKDYEFSYIDLNKALIKFGYDSNGELNLSGEVGEIIKDTDNYFKIEAESNIDIYFTGEFEVSLLVPTALNAIKFKINSTSTVMCTLRIIDTDGITHTFNTISTNDVAEWNFIQKNITKFYITINSTNSNGLSETNSFVTNIIVNKIEAFNDFYEKTSSIVTKKINFRSIIDKIKLEAKDSIMPGTNIEYFIAIDNGVTSLNWINITNNKDVDLNLLEEKQVFLNKDVQYYGHSLKNNCYMIGNLNNHYNSNSIKILAGYQQWNVEVLNSEKFNSNYVLDINDYNKDKVIERTSIDYESYNIKIKPNKMYAMNTKIYSDNDYETKEFYINNDIKTGNKFQEIVIFNNNIVKKTKGTYKFAFKKGKNIVNILLICNTECNFTHNLNFKSISQNCGHGGKLKQVNENYLMNNINKNNDEFYCIDSNNNIIVKINPLQESQYFKSNIEKTDINYQDYTKYYLSYKFLTRENYHLCLKNNIPNVDLRLMMVLNSNSIFISPEVHSYILKGR